MTSLAGNFDCLTQFMRSHGLLFLVAISWIFFIEEDSFGSFNYFLEFTSVWSWSGGMICRQIPATLFIPLCFKVFSNIDIFWILNSEFICNWHEFLYYFFIVWNIGHANVFQSTLKLIDKFYLFFAILDNCLSFVLNKFFSNNDIDL